MIQKVALYCISLLLLLACSNTKRKIADLKTGGNIFKYAKNIYSRPGSDSVTVYFSWDGQRDSITYHLFTNNSIAQTATDIHIPALNIAALSTTDIAMISELGEIATISGVCDPFRITNQQIKQRVTDGKIQNVGTSMEANMESLLALNPDLIISSAFGKSDFQKFTTLQAAKMIPVVYTMSWQETSPLARVEWIKFIGMLLNQYDKADSTFSQIERQYLSYKKIASNVTHRPKVLAGSGTNDIWYMPGGKSYIATFIADAGGDFIGKDDNSTGSVVLNFEQVLQKSADADLWIGCDEKTYADLDALNKNYRLLHVYQKKAIYNRTKRTNADGGNDYWEYGYIRPDLVLADYLRTIHPELLPEYETIFFEKLKD